MNRLRITIAQITLVVLVVAIALAAIRSGSAAWAGAIFSITFFAMICSFLGIALGRAMRRIYWSGFATLGWSYLVLIYVPWLNENVGRFLLAPNLCVVLEEVIHPPASAAGGGLQSLPLEIVGTAATGGGFGGGTLSRVVDQSDFVRIGMALEALLWAFFGGWVACYFASGHDQRVNSETPRRGNAPMPGEQVRRNETETPRNTSTQESRGLSE
jgi:hypothetical protein